MKHYIQEAANLGCGIWDIISSPTHRNQECLVLNINNYAYIVPFAQEGNRVFLKTIYPSRKHTKYYLKGAYYE